MTLSVLDAARECPSSAALVRDGEITTFSELAEHTRQAIATLAEHGVRRGAKTPVAIVAATDMATLALLYALFELGVPALLLHPRWTPGERESALAGSNVRLIWDGSPLIRAAGGAIDAARDNAEMIAAIVYTSGSSGSPKGIAISRRAFTASAAASAANLGWQPHDRWLLSLPPAHVGGLSVLTRCLLARKTVAISVPQRDRSGVDPASLVQIVEQDQVTILSLVPTLLGRLLALEPRWQPPRSLRAMLIGGAALPAALGEDARKRDWPVLTTYGLTETCSQVTTQRPMGPRRHGDSGYPLDGISIRVVDGRIQVKGPVLFSSYYPSGAKPVLDDGWFETNDLGFLDECGALHVTGRASELIITGGENVWPSEVEAALGECTGVRAACVFGVPDDAWGEIVAAVVVPDGAGGGLLDALALFMTSRLASFKRPRRFALAPELPTTAAGKVDRREVIRLFADKLRPLT